MEKLRVWHIPQAPMKPFYVEVSSIEEACKIINALQNYDKFQYENNIKPDYTSASGLEYFDEEEQNWFEWFDNDGYDIEQYVENLEVE